TGREDYRDPKKSMRVVGDSAEQRGQRREELMDIVNDNSPSASVSRLCSALDVSRATLYRRRSPPAAARPRPPSHRRLSDKERQEVLDMLRSDRFVDRAPTEVAHTLLEEAGQYHCSVRTMYRILEANGEVRE